MENAPERAGAVVLLGEAAVGREAARVIETSAPSDRRCRCGNRLAAGRTAFGVTAVPGALVPLFDREVFCSMGCVRAYFLEELAILESIATPESESQLDGLRLMYRYLVASLERLIDEWHVALRKGDPPRAG